MSMRKYRDTYFVLQRNCESLCGSLQGIDVCHSRHTAVIDTVVPLLPHKHVVNRCTIASTPHGDPADTHFRQRMCRPQDGNPAGRIK